MSRNGRVHRPDGDDARQVDAHEAGVFGVGGRQQEWQFTPGLDLALLKKTFAGAQRTRRRGASRSDFFAAGGEQFVLPDPAPVGRPVGVECAVHATFQLVAPSFDGTDLRVQGLQIMRLHEAARHGPGGRRADPVSVVMLVMPIGMQHSCR